MGSLRTIAIPRQAGVYTREAREARGLTRKELSELSGVSVRTITSLELGDAPGIQLDKLLAVLGALGLSLNVSGCPDAPDGAQHRRDGREAVRAPQAKTHEAARRKTGRPAPEEPLDYGNLGAAYKAAVQEILDRHGATNESLTNACR